MSATSTPDDEIRSVSDLLDKVEKLRPPGEHHAHIRFWFRGHAQEGWKLTPGVYRPDFVSGDECARLLKERHLTQDFRMFSTNLRTGYESDEDIYFIQQHYRMPTRLLDWTTNPLAALYFAVNEQNKGSGKLFMMDAYQLATTQGVGHVFRGIATVRQKIFQHAIDRIANWRDDRDFPDFILPIRPGYFDGRIRRQHSYFTFHVPSHSELGVAENRTLQSFRIPDDAKPGLRDQLSLLGVNHFTVYGGLDHLSEWLKSAHAEA